MPSLSWLAETPNAALKGLRHVVDEVITDMTKNEEAIPQPFTQRHYSGKFTLRLTSEQHQALAIQAAERHISVNKLASSRVMVDFHSPSALSEEDTSSRSKRKTA
jgi:predicted HicB family RNase H-like nuclease